MMMLPEADPYGKLGLDPGADEAAIRQAYRRLAQQHHPDHNDGSPAAARRFEDVHAAYLEILRRRAAAAPARSEAEEAALNARLAALEQELRGARRNRKRRERRAQRKGIGRPGQRAPAEADPAVTQLSTLIDGLEALASQLDAFE